MSMTHCVLAYYQFVEIEDPALEVGKHHSFFEGKDATGRIYISKQGINGQMSASSEVAQAYMEWMHTDPRFQTVDFKIHPHHEHVFPRMTVKVREQLVALDDTVDLSKRGEYLTPARWGAMLDERDENTLLLDVRNDYEWEVGHFEGAALPKLEMFRKFPAFAKDLKKKRSPKTTRVMMYCTGGIRCELYSSLLKREGFEKVYQLQGGVIKYGLDVGKKHWRGKLFVFDDRLTIPISKDEDEVISRCCHCDTSSDVYYNCANMDCNELFLSCEMCAEKFQGCCSPVCQKAERVRPYEKGTRPKPFRKAYTYD
ncbi:MAG: rhodanese-related sulfurtransferase [Chlamydiales bacterium]